MSDIFLHIDILVNLCNDIRRIECHAMFSYII